MEGRKEEGEEDCVGSDDELLPRVGAHQPAGRVRRGQQREEAPYPLVQPAADALQLFLHGEMFIISTLFVQFVILLLRDFIYEEIIERDVNKSGSRLYIYAPKVA
jgi:hypothetical protein